MSEKPSKARNRLASESSPYLLLHQDNPVDWYPWGEEALEKARREDKPIFLSVGYSTCFWCHVMERESFTDPAIAALMNEHFVNVKVDREERPDLDEVYMAATQILTGHGGWPNSVFLTPALEPFYAGTYFPPADRYGRPGFATVLTSLADAWRQRRPEVEEAAAQVTERMRRYLEQEQAPLPQVPGPEVARRSLADLAGRFDAEWGGFGSAPKFPTPSNLYLLLELAGDDSGAAEMLETTLDQMARGGIYDQLGGGFHRYATDRQWRVPHFEKMLYDNGFLLEIYALEHARSSDPQAARVVRETAAWLAREMTGDDGALWSAIDAETAGDEGAFYVWSRADLEAVLEPPELSRLAPIYGFDGAPFFEGERYVLHLTRPLPELAAAAGVGVEELWGQIESARRRLLAARGERPRPLTDDKVLADWNGIAIRGLAVAGQVLGDAALVAQAERAAAAVLTRLRPAGGPLRHAGRGDTAKIPAYLSDYAFLVRGLLALHEATGDERWRRAAVELTEEQIQRLRDPRGGYFVAAEDPALLLRSKDPIDGALPSANAVAVLNLLDLARITGEERWRREAATSLRAFGGLLEAAPEALRMMAVAARRYGAPQGAAARVGVGPLEAEARSAVALALELEEPDAEGWRRFRLRLDIAEGWHVNTERPALDFLIPTRVAGRGAELRRLAYPPAVSLSAAFAEAPLEVWTGRVEISGDLRALAADAGLTLTYQACDEGRCLPPVTVELAAAPAAP